MSASTIPPTTLPSASPSSSSNSNSSPTGNNPLLFFVALGFGIVFTNLWIIIGVKYCVRYQRSRAIRVPEEVNPDDPSTAHRTHRRRREKRLMTQQEVNERFPIVKYNAWLASRQISNPLPTADNATDSEKIEEIPASPISISAGNNTNTNVESPATYDHVTSVPVPATKEEGPSSISAATPRLSKNDETDDEYDDDQDDPPRPGNASQCSVNSHNTDCGDTCAICIDTLHDLDDVRGLTCGHAFHAACLDPWLTGRRACCPLCKADYHKRPKSVTTHSPTRATSSLHVSQLPSTTTLSNNVPPSPIVQSAFILFGGGIHAAPQMPTIPPVAFSTHPPPRNTRWDVFHRWNSPASTTDPSPSQLEAGQAPAHPRTMLHPVVNNTVS